MTTFPYCSENLNENVTLRCAPQLPDKQLISVKWFLDGALLKQLPDCRNRYSTWTSIQPEMEFKEFDSRFKSAKTRFKFSAGLNLETFDTILSGTNHI